MPSDTLRIAVTGLTNVGKSTLLNALLGQNLLPASFQSETSVMTYIVPQCDQSEPNPTLHAYSRGLGGELVLRAAAEGSDDVRSQLQLLNASAAGAEESQVIECRVNSPMRQSLLKAAQWHRVQMVDIGGTDDVLNPAVNACANIAYSMSHQIIICVKHDRVRSSEVSRLINELRSKVPHFFQTPLVHTTWVPLIFVITQADQIQAEFETESKGVESLREALRQLLIQTLGDTCEHLARSAPIVVVSALNSLNDTQPAFEWNGLENILIRSLDCRTQVVATCKIECAVNMRRLIKQNLDTLQGQWPFHASECWDSRRSRFKSMIAAPAAVVAAGSLVGGAYAAGMYITAASTAATASAQAAAATAASNTWYAWLFGFGQYGAAAAAATANANAAGACAASAGATAALWGGSAALSTSVAGAAGQMSASSQHLPSGVASLAGATIVHAASLGAGGAGQCLKGLQFSATASGMKSGEKYTDVLYYSESKERELSHACTIRCRELQSLAWLNFPFQLLSCQYQKCLYTDGSSVGCRSNEYADQLWWAVPGSIGETFCLQSAKHDDAYLGAGETLNINPYDQRTSLSCTSSSERQSWFVLPGSSPHTVRLKNIDQNQYLYFDGWWAGCCTEKNSNQEWIVVPKIPLYIGNFKFHTPCGPGQVFWPNGSPAFKGDLLDGNLQRGFLFDERGVCHGHFRFSDEGPQIDGFQPAEVDNEGVCILCEERPLMLAIGSAFHPCGHGLVCEVCAKGLQECPYCRSPVESLMRVS